MNRKRRSRSSFRPNRIAGSRRRPNRIAGRRRRPNGIDGSRRRPIRIDGKRRRQNGRRRRSRCHDVYNDEDTVFAKIVVIRDYRNRILV